MRLIRSSLQNEYTGIDIAIEENQRAIAVRGAGCVLKRHDLNQEAVEKRRELFPNMVDENGQIK